MKFTMREATGLPAGSYPAKFTGAEPFENDFGPGVKLLFEVTAGEHAGEVGSRITSEKFSSKSNLYKVTKAGQRWRD